MQRNNTISACGPNWRCVFSHSLKPPQFLRGYTQTGTRSIVSQQWLTGLEEGWKAGLVTSMAWRSWTLGSTRTASRESLGWQSSCGGGGSSSGYSRNNTADCHGGGRGSSGCSNGRARDSLVAPLYLWIKSATACTGGKLLHTERGAGSCRQTPSQSMRVRVRGSAWEILVLSFLGFITATSTSDRVCVSVSMWLCEVEEQMPKPSNEIAWRD